MIFKLRDNQKQASQKVVNILSTKKVCYLAGETRSGKTHTALSVGDAMNFSNVLFVSKKKALTSIESAPYHLCS
jgi:superfamily II DNA or RNA helicase